MNEQPGQLHNAAAILVVLGCHKEWKPLERLLRCSLRQLHSLVPVLAEDSQSSFTMEIRAHIPLIDRV